MFEDCNLGDAAALFLEEARELLAQMESLLLDAETGAVDAEAQQALFRCAHTIKGSAGMFGFDGVVRFTHDVEGVLDRLRSGKLEFSPALAALLLECKDHIATLIAGNSSATVEAQLRLRLQEYLGTAGAASVPAAPQDVSPGAELKRIPGGPSAGPDHWHISLRCSPEVLKSGLDPLNFLHYLERYGQIVYLEVLPDRLPAWEDYDAELCYLGFEVDLLSEASKDKIESVFDFIRDDAQVRILPPHSRMEAYVALIDELPEDEARLGDILVAGGCLTERELKDALAAQRSEQAASQGTARPLGEILVDGQLVPQPLVNAALDKQKRADEKRVQEARSLKVPAARLDTLIDLVGELVIAGATNHMLARGSGGGELAESAGNLLRLVEDIRDTALRLRMVPIGEVFGRFPRIVRDTARELGKDIELVVSGAETELDKSMVERIADPLMHMVRNAMDHGIEPAAQRMARGKPAKGTVALNAYHDSGSIVIEVVDDGGGLDLERIQAKALERGLLTPGQMLSREEIFRLVFAPGFSTAAQVTSLSGRGVGMDVVKRNIEALRGTVAIESEMGGGTTMRICLPLTLAIIDGFEVQVGQSHFILPLDSVVECIDLPDVEAGYLNLRGEVLPFMHLSHLFEQEAQAGDSSRQRRSVVVVRAGARKAGIAVDRLFGECQVVIKPLGRLFEKVRGISGSTILGSGRVALILDVPQLVALASLREAEEVR